MRVVARSLLTAICTFVMLQVSLVAMAQTPGPASAEVHFPSLVGKSSQEIEKLFGKHTWMYRGPRAQPWCDEVRRYKVVRRLPRLSVGFRDDRAVILSYAFEPKKDLETPEAALATLGIDVHNKPPLLTAERSTTGTPSDPRMAPLFLLIFGTTTENDLLWSGEFGGVRWEWLWVRGAEGGRFLWKDIKPRYYSVVAYVGEAL